MRVRPIYCGLIVDSIAERCPLLLRGSARAADIWLPHAMRLPPHCAASLAWVDFHPFVPLPTTRKGAQKWSLNWTGRVASSPRPRSLAILAVSWRGGAAPQDTR
jgi:hypothetical protein